MMEEFFAANKIIVLRGLLCSDAILQNDYTALVASLDNENWEKENEVLNFSFYKWKRNFMPNLSTIVFFDEHNNINRAIHCYGTHNSLREYLRS